MRHIRSLLPVGLMLLDLTGAPARGQENEAVAQRMFAIALRYDADRQRGGMAGLIQDIQNCYMSATTPVINVIGVRDCLVLDFTGDMTDEHVGRLINGGSLPYWVNVTAANRWRYYGHVAQFPTKYQLAQYLRDSYQLVNMNLARISRVPH